MRSSTQYTRKPLNLPLLCTSDYEHEFRDISTSSGAFWATSFDSLELSTVS